MKAARAGNVYPITDEPKVRVGKDAITAPINTGTNDDTDPTTDEEIEELMGPENRRLSVKILMMVRHVLRQMK